MTQPFHSWVYVWKNKNTNSKRYMHSNFHSSSIYNCQDMEATSMSINRWMDKDVLHTYKIFAICSNMDGLGGYCPKWNKSEKDKIVWSLICGIKKIKQTSEYNKKGKLTNVENTLLVTSGEKEVQRGKIRVGD